MSRLTSFAAAMFTKARAVIGGEDLTVGTGAAVSAVLSEIVTSHDDYSEGGFPLVESCVAVVSIADWSSAYSAAAITYLKHTATLRGQTMRVERITAGQSFVTITLKSARKG